MRCHDRHNSANVAEATGFISISCISTGHFLSLMRPDTPSDEFPAPGLHFRRRIGILHTWICISSASGAGLAFPVPPAPDFHFQRLSGAGSVPQCGTVVIFNRESV